MKKALLIISILTSIFANAQSYNFEQGVKAYKDNDFEQALDYFGRELKDNPKNAVALYYRAAIYKYNENYSSALSEINSAIKNFTKNDKEWLAIAHKLRAGVYTEIEDYDKALNDFSIAIKLTPNDKDLYLERAQLYFELKNYEQAEADYRLVLEMDDSEVLAWAGLGRNYTYQKNYKEAEQTLTKLIKLSPDYIGGYFYRSLLYRELKKNDEAIVDIFKCLLLDETDKIVANLFISFSKENTPLALSKVNAKLAANPEKEFWYFIRARIKETKNNYTSALEDYTKVLELTDVDTKNSVLEYRAKCYSNSGMYAKAIADFTSILSTDSSDAYTYGSRADAKRLMGDYYGAIEDFSKAIQIEPREGWFYYRRGWIKDEFLKKYQEGLADYNECIAIDKEYAYTYLHRGRLYAEKLNSPEKAKQDFEKIILIDTAIRNQGNCTHYALFHLGRIEEAIQWANKMIEKYPTEGNYYDLTCLYSLMKDQKKALFYLNLAFENGFRDFTHLAKDDDLDNIRNIPEFKNLVLQWKKVFDETENISSNQINPTEKISETTTIPMTPKGSGVYEVSCRVNDLRLKFVFDTGASDISISQTESLFMLKNGYLNANDIVGKQSYIDANGNITVGTKIILRQVEIGGLLLKNITASVVNNSKAPLLFGQSALAKYGKIIIDNKKNTITMSTEN